MRLTENIAVVCESGFSPNSTIAHHSWDFPSRLLGEAEVRRILEEADFAEAETLIRNPNVTDTLLEQLYKREGPFAKIDDDRWCGLVSRSHLNERLNGEKEYDDSPDLGHYRIHKAILQLLETAPVSKHWVIALYYLIDSLDPAQCARIERSEQFASILSRWKAVVISGYKDGEVQEGYFASTISLTDEFRCLIAALYGSGLKQPEIKSASQSDDVAMRAVYYAHGRLTLDDLEAANDREFAVFAFAAMYNSCILFQGELRKRFEQLLFQVWNKRFSKQVEFARKHWPNHVDKYVPNDRDVKASQVDEGNPRLDRIEAAVKVLNHRIDAIGARLQQYLSYAVGAAIVLAITYYFRK